MKQSRPAAQLGVLVLQERVAEAMDVLFSETTTIGVRFSSMTRWKLRRQEVAVETPYGAVGAKVAFRGDTLMNVAPEVRDCRRLAAACNVPLKDVYHAAQQAARAQSVVSLGTSVLADQ